MDYVKLGRTGLEVSRLCLGGMSYGDPSRGGHPWVVREDEAKPMLAAALDAGISFIDTANVYSGGSSEEIIGRFLKGAVDRDEVVVATKVHGRMRPGANGAGLSRKAILSEVDHSLRRLQLDYVDLLWIHRFDPTTPIEETLQALDDLVRSGKVRYLGASSMPAWRFATMLFTADLHGWSRFVAMQPHYNLLYREEEREMFGLCAEQGIGVMPWSPLARGRLTRAWDDSTVRQEGDAFGQTLYHDEADRDVAAAVGRVADARGVTRAQVALAWVLRHPVVTAPIVGFTKQHHLDDALAALDLHLTEAEVAELESPYRPHPAQF